MNRNLVKGLQVAWELPEFRSAVQHLIDLDEVTVLLATLSAADQDHDPEVERSLLRLVRSALDTAEIRDALLLLLERDDVRRPLVVALVPADRPGQAAAITSAAEDPAVRRELRAVLDDAKVRDLIWQTVDDQVNQHRFGVVRRAVVLFVRHPAVRRLAWALRRHGVLRELRRKQ